MFLKFKNSVALLLTLLLLVNVLSSFFVISTFYSNQTYFVDNFCVNKAQPTLCCKATCHLNKILKVVDSEQSSPESLKLSSLSFEYIVAELLLIDTSCFSNRVRFSRYYSNLYHSILGSLPKHPPRG